MSFIRQTDKTIKINLTLGGMSALSDILPFISLIEGNVFLLLPQLI